MDGRPAPRAIRRRRRSPAPARAGLPAVAVALAVYLFLIIGRLPDEFPALRLALVSAVITGLLVLLGPHGDASSMFRWPETRAVLALFGLAMATIPFSVWPGESFIFVTRAYPPVVFAFVAIVYRVRSARSVQIVLGGFLAAMLFLEVALMLWGKGDRPYVTNTYDSNDIAFVMVCGFPLAATWFLRGRGVGRYVAGLISAVAVVTVLLTRSRGGLVSLCIVMAILLLTAFSRQRTAAVALVLACILILGIFGSRGYWERMGTIWSGGEPRADSVGDYDASGVWGARWGLWQGGLRIMLQHPLIGVGAGVSPIAEGLSHKGAGKWSATHNSFLEIGVELGLPGLALFLFLLYRAVKNCRGVIHLARRQTGLATEAWLARGVELSLYGYMVAGFGLSQGYSAIPYALVATSVALAHASLARARTSGPPGKGPVEGTMTGPSGTSR